MDDLGLPFTAAAPGSLRPCKDVCLVWSIKKQVGVDLMTRPVNATVCTSEGKVSNRTRMRSKQYAGQHHHNYTFCNLARAWGLEPRARLVWMPEIGNDQQEGRNLEFAFQTCPARWVPPPPKIDHVQPLPSLRTDPAASCADLPPLDRFQRRLPASQICTFRGHR